MDKTISATSQFDVLGVVGFVGERRLYSVSANVGDVLNVSAYGSAHSGRSALYLTRVYVYDPDKTLVASGYKYEGAFGGQYSDLGNLASIPADKAGPTPSPSRPTGRPNPGRWGRSAWSSRSTGPRSRWTDIPAGRSRAAC